MNKTLAKNNRGGYAILFAVVIVSIISMISIGLSNTSYKQLILSSLANDSQTAFFQSDTATECALYADNKIGLSVITSPWSCGMKDDSTAFSFTLTTGGSTDPADYSFMPNNAGTNQCFNFKITKTPSGAVQTTIDARGYNSCDLTSQKTVERAIKVTY